MAKAAKQGGEPPKDVAATFRADPQQIEDIKAVAYWERLTMKEVMAEALADRIAKHKKNNKGQLKPIPKK